MTPDTPRRYFDWAATAIPDPAAASAEAAPFGNPSSRHAEGREARAALENARARCAAVLRVRAEQLCFTSGGTEANAIVLHSVLRRPRSGTVLFSAVEHPSVRENCLMLERLGKKIGVIGVEGDGRVTEAGLEKALVKYPDARLAAIMAVNNETGSIMDVAAISGFLKNREGPPVHLHCDMVQAAGKTPLDLSLVDSAAISAHKIGGPRGIGLLFLKKPLDALASGGGQERGLRPGTENVAGALALAAALERRADPAAVAAERVKAEARFSRLIAGLRASGRCALIPRDRADIDPRFSPYVAQAAFKGIPGEVMVRALDSAGFAVSTGSACSSTSPDRPVLAAMGASADEQREGIRVSQGWSTTEADIAALLDGVKRVVTALL
jgi:cysteine desulfurase